MNILLVAMSLDIGGAETHVVSLAKELKRKGHVPIVMSSGGIYVNEIEKYGIYHLNAPLHKKDIKSIIKSYKMMRKIIKDKQIDIIHSHGRIPALIGKMVSTIYRIPFMTTAHAKFIHTGLYRYLSFWGEEVIAVSEDIKNHLINNFGVEEGKFTIIKNGIDTDVFSKKEDNIEVNKELKLKSDTKKLVYISRMSDKLADLAKLVIQIGQELHKEGKNIELIVVGDGDDFQQVKRAGVKANEEANEKFVNILGKRTDIPDIINIADVLICVARTAIEAISCEKPVILAGGEGYMGLLNEDNIDIAISNNFTGRNVESEITKESLKKEILKVIDGLSHEDIENLGNLGRKTVLAKYSVISMVEETISIYESLLKRRNRN